MPKRNPPPPMTPEIVARIRHLRRLGFYQHDIAAYYGYNQGRISEIVRGKRFPGVPPDDAPPTVAQYALPF